MNKVDSVYESDFKIYDMAIALVRRRKFIFFAILVGGLVGCLVLWIKGVEVQTEARPVGSMNYFEWKRFTAGLPALAEERLGSAKGAEQEVYRRLRKPEWWSSNVRPQFVLSKSDVKTLSAVSKDDLERTAVMITSIDFSWSGQTRDEAVARLEDVKRFVGEGSLYLSLKSVIDNYDLSVRRADVEIASKIATEERELGYRRSKAVALEDLHKQYPDATSSQSLGVLANVSTESAARYLPVGAQLLALKTEIIASEQVLARLHGSIEEARVQRDFLSKAQAVVKSARDGFELASGLEKAVADVKKSVDPANSTQIAALGQISQSISSKHERAKTLFESGGMASVLYGRSALIVGFFALAGGVLAALIVLARIGWAEARRRDVAGL